jgi:hypothetical protein
MWEHLLNLRDYTPLEFVLFAGGCYLWVPVYLIYIKEIRNHGHVGMPIFAAAGNFAWEFIWGFIPPGTDMGPLLQWCYRIWFLLDIYIFFGIIKYGQWQISTPLVKKYHKLIIAAVTVFWIILYYHFKQGGHDTPIGANSAFIAQFTLSFLYLHLMLRHPHERYNPWVAWLRTIGSGMNDVFMFMHYPDNHFLHTLCVGSFLADCCFIYLLYRRPAGETVTEQPATSEEYNNVVPARV